MALKFKKYLLGPKGPFPVSDLAHMSSTNYEDVGVYWWSNSCSTVHTLGTYDRSTKNPVPQQFPTGFTEANFWVKNRLP